MSQARTTELLETEAGNKGVEIVIDTVERTGVYAGFVVTSAVVLTSMTPKVALDAGSDAFSDLTTIPVGRYDFGFTKIKLASGEAILIKG